MTRAEELLKRLQKGGISFVEELIATRKSEELFLDFKRSADNGVGRRLHADDSNAFSRAISGFGNSEGGIIIWGVDCSQDKQGADVAAQKVPVVDAVAFASRLESATSRCTIPPHSTVRNIPLTEPDSLSGFVVSFVPKSDLAPHQSVSRMQYYMRAGSDFVPVPHGVLSGMFGKRPQPNVQARYLMQFPEFVGESVCFEVGLAVQNRGPGIARDVYLTVECTSMPCAVGALSFDVVDKDNWIVTHTLGFHMSYLAKEGVRLAPNTQLLPAKLKLKLTPPFKGDLNIEGSAGCDGGPPFSFRFASSAADVSAMYTAAMAAKRSRTLNDAKFSHFPSNILGLRKYDASDGYANP
jgi:hypothetical protein